MHNNDSLFPFMNFETVFQYTTLETLPTFDKEQDGISVIKFEAVSIHFLSDLFVAVAVVVPSAPQ